MDLSKGGNPVHICFTSLIAACLLSITAAGAAGAAKEKPVPDRGAVYKTVGDVELKIHIFEPEGGGERRPAIVFFFGGGWVGGNPGQFYPQCKYLASRGMVAMSAEYRVKSRHGTSPFECVKDGKSALRWVRVHADELGIDVDKVVAGGGSAGGHVAACTGVIPGVEEDGEDLSVSSVPNAMVLFNPVADTTSLGYGQEKLGGRAEELSPAHHVKAGAPPTIIFHGKDDTTVPYENVERFRDKMKEAENTCELVGFEGKKHGFFNYGRDKTSFDETMEAAGAFLVKHGFLAAK
jgi:acetyl esterase/lipase